MLPKNTTKGFLRFSLSLGALQKPEFQYQNEEWKENLEQGPGRTGRFSMCSLPWSLSSCLLKMLQITAQDRLPFKIRNHNFPEVYFLYIICDLCLLRTIYPMTFMSVSRNNGGKYVLYSRDSHTSSEVHLVRGSF